jgi:hypothetical protein
VLSLIWAIVLLGYLGSSYTTTTGTYGIISMIAISLVILYVDADNAKQAGELDLNHPILVPAVVLILWLITVPAYVLYRFHTRSSA